MVGIASLIQTKVEVKSSIEELYCAQFWSAPFKFWVSDMKARVVFRFENPT